MCVCAKKIKCQVGEKYLSTGEEKCCKAILNVSVKSKIVRMRCQNKSYKISISVTQNCSDLCCEE